MHKRLVLVVVVLVLARILVAGLLPIMRDEAYYALWAQHLAFGYLDHPPLVAFATLGTLLAPAEPFAARLGSLLLALGSIVLFVRMCRYAGLKETPTLVTALILGHGSLAALASGFLTTPDAGLAFAWTLALHEALAALLKDRRRWLSAGFAVGLGLLAKYHMVLMYGVFLWVLWRHQRATLQTRWPWLGALLAVLVFSPNIYWNASHQFVTMKFQLAHGFGMDRSSLVTGILPNALDDQEGSVEDLLARSFGQADVDAPIKKPKKKKREKPWYERVTNRVTDFAGSQLGLWGALLVPMGIALVRRRRQEKSWRTAVAALTQSLRDAIPSSALSLLGAATLIPLIFFGLIGLGGKIEANWPAMYMIAAAVLLAVLCAGIPRPVKWGAFINLAVITAGALHARTSALPGAGAEDRLLNEAAGYPELTAYLREQGTPLFVDTFQNRAVIKFRAPDLQVSQWPGITRPSEFTRSPRHYPADVHNQVATGFRLLTDESVPPRIPGYFPTDLIELRHCTGQPLAVITRAVLGTGTIKCKKPRRVWRQMDYVPYPGFVPTGKKPAI